MTHPQFRKFKVDWGVYKEITNPPEAQIGPQLYSCCEDEVQSAIINVHGQNFFSMSEAEMLLAIERIVTRRANPTVHRMAFCSIVGDLFTRNKRWSQENKEHFNALPTRYYNLK